MFIYVAALIIHKIVIIEINQLIFNNNLREVFNIIYINSIKKNPASIKI